MSVKLSFILPCYNVGRYITETLGNIYVQGLSDDEFEVICIDDCSTDDTYDRIAAFAEGHDPLDPQRSGPAGTPFSDCGASARETSATPDDLPGGSRTRDRHIHPPVETIQLIAKDT